MSIAVYRVTIDEALLIENPGGAISAWLTSPLSIMATPGYFAIPTVEVRDSGGGGFSGVVEHALHRRCGGI